MTSGTATGPLAYVDTSAYVKLVLGEPEADALRGQLAHFGGAVSSALLRIEAVRACARYGEPYAAAARDGLDRVALLPVTDDLLDAGAGLRPAGLRSLDALHLATALSLGGDLGALIAYDARLGEAAADAGVPVLAPR